MWGMFPMFPMYPTMLLPRNCDLPPTLYSILESIVNFDVENKTKISDLASVGRTFIFDFSYPLSTKVDKAEFETLILNKFLMRRIGFDTLTSFKIHLNVKLNEIMPNYNKLFDMLGDWNLFSSGEVITRVKTNNKEATLTGESSTINSGLNTETNSVTNTTSSTEMVSGIQTEDKRFSDTPENELIDVQNGNYVSEYNYNTTNANNTTTTNGTSSENGTNTKNNYNNETSTKEENNTEELLENETITRSNADKIKIYKEFLENRTNIMTLIFKDLDSLFYGLV